jgi:hypothetical protein
VKHFYRLLPSGNCVLVDPSAHVQLCGILRRVEFTAGELLLLSELTGCEFEQETERGRFFIYRDTGRGIQFADDFWNSMDEPIARLDDAIGVANSVAKRYPEDRWVVLNAGTGKTAYSTQPEAPVGI